MKRPSTLTPYDKAIIPLLLLSLLWYTYVLYTITSVEKNAFPRHADVAIILGAAVWNDQPSPGLRERLDLAYSLYRDGYVPCLLVSGGLGDGKQVAEAVAMKNYLMAKGVPEEDILVENQSRNTYENLLFSKRLMEKHHLRSALVVSHGYHLARATEMAATLQLDVTPVGAASHVMYLPYYRSKEVLAYTKWKLTQLFL